MTLAVIILHSSTQENSRNLLMGRILQCAGPVILYASHLGTTNHRIMVTRSDYDQATKELEELGLGTVVSLQLSNAPTPKTVFVKKLPADAKDILEANPGICDFEKYRTSYSMPMSRYVTVSIKKKLIEMGYSYWFQGYL